MLLPGKPPWVMSHAPLILTGELDIATQERFERERRQYFPPERNHIPAHVSMFHALPGAELDALVERLHALAVRSRPAVEIVGLRPLGTGVAYVLHSPALQAIQAELARDWAAWLGPQDRQGYRPHVTVQNKVSIETARDTLAQLRSGFAPWTATSVALRLWRYLGGPWENVERIVFRA